MLNLEKMDWRAGLSPNSAGSGFHVFYNFKGLCCLNADLAPSERSKIQQKLQEYANSGYPILRSTGSQYIILAAKKSPKTIP